jgi:hypothetical protein
VALEAGWDGGNLKVSVNGGPFQLVAPSEFAFNNYHALLFTAAQGNTNPLAGQPAWTGTTGGSMTSGVWGRSLANLGNMAKPGDRIRLRWDLGTDGCSGRDGWYMDTATVFSCTPRVPELTIADISQPEGNAANTRTPFTFTVRMDAATDRGRSAEHADRHHRPGDRQVGGRRGHRGARRGLRTASSVAAPS